MIYRIAKGLEVSPFTSTKDFSERHIEQMRQFCFLYSKPQTWSADSENKSQTSSAKSKIGQVVNKYGYESPNHFPFVRLGAFVVRPNHVRGIVMIDKPGRVLIDPAPAIVV